MRSVTTSLKAFGLYMMLVPGIGLMAIPGALLDFFGLSHGAHPWAARVVGLLAFIIGSYQFSIARHGLNALYRTTVWQRYFAAVFFMGLWITGEAAIAIVLFALIDITGATWTLLASSRDEESY